MLLSEAFFTKEDLETALRANGYEELVPYYKLIFENEKQYVMTASCPEPYVGMAPVPNSKDILVFTPGPRAEVEYKINNNLPEGAVAHIFRLNCAEQIIVSLKGN